MFEEYIGKWIYNNDSYIFALKITILSFTKENNMLGIYGFKYYGSTGMVFASRNYFLITEPILKLKCKFVKESEMIIWLSRLAIESIFSKESY